MLRYSPPLYQLSYRELDVMTGTHFRIQTNKQISRKRYNTHCDTIFCGKEMCGTFWARIPFFAHLSLYTTGFGQQQVHLLYCIKAKQPERCVVIHSFLILFISFSPYRSIHTAIQYTSSSSTVRVAVKVAFLIENEDRNASDFVAQWFGRQRETSPAVLRLSSSQSPRY